MARLESKSVSVMPADEQQAIEKHELFGWVLQGSQEIFNKDTRQEARGDEVWNVTTTTNYVKLVFQRDLDTPNLAQIKEIESQYWGVYKASKYFPTSMRLKTVLILVGVGMLPGIVSSNGLLLFAGLIVALGIWAVDRFVLYPPKAKRAYEMRTKCAELEEQAKTLL